jgi:predicted transcriptional regulator YdeE
MKFFLTIYICSVVTQNCAEVPVENHNYNRFYETHGECVQKGLGESYSILFDGKLFKIDTVNAMELYPKFMCEKTDNPKAPEESASTT